MPKERDPFHKYVDDLENRKWRCKFCGNKFAGSTPRIRAHFAGIPGRGIKACEKVDNLVRAEALQENKGEGSGLDKRTRGKSVEGTEGTDMQNSNQLGCAPQQPSFYPLTGTGTAPARPQDQGSLPPSDMPADNLDNTQQSNPSNRTLDSAHRTENASSPQQLLMDSSPSPSLDIKPPVKARKQTDWLGTKRSVLIVVASLIVTVAFQATLSPPGGFWQDDFTADPAKNGMEKSHRVGMAVMATALPQAYGQFMIFNTLAFLSSMSIILLGVSGLPIKRRRWMWTQMVTMWVSITALTITYFIAWIHMTPEDNRGVLNTVTRVSVFLWLCLMGIVFLGNVVRMVRRFSRKYGCLKLKEREASPVVEENVHHELIDV